MNRFVVALVISRELNLSDFSFVRIWLTALRRDFSLLSAKALALIPLTTWNQAHHASFILRSSP